MKEQERAFKAVASGAMGSNAFEHAGENGQRTLVFHYHLFKNAGTSVDELLRRNFGARWASQEFRVGRRDNVATVAAFIQNNPHLHAISSHTALLPVPRIKGLEVFPIIFIRHPIDRLRSAYEFERNQVADTFGARVAKACDFGGYLRSLLKNRDRREARNFQTFRLAHNENGPMRTEMERALRALDALPFVGFVEGYDCCMSRLEQILRPRIPGFRSHNSHKNNSQSRNSELSERLRAIRTSLGHDFYEEVCAANKDDLKIYETVRQRHFAAMRIRSDPAT